MAPSNLELAVGTKVTNLDFLSRAIFKHSFLKTKQMKPISFFLLVYLWVQNQNSNVHWYILYSFSKLCLIYDPVSKFSHRVVFSTGCLIRLWSKVNVSEVEKDQQFYWFMASSGFRRFGNLCFINQFFKKWHPLASTASDRKSIRYQLKIGFLMIHSTKRDWYWSFGC